MIKLHADACFHDTGRPTDKTVAGFCGGRRNAILRLAVLGMIPCNHSHWVLRDAELTP